MGFNPFKKDLRDLDGEDLSVLLKTSEGWFVEYKGEVPSAKSIAKSISAFANHNGGWLLLGVDAERGGDNVARGFPGVSLKDWVQTQERISSAVSGGISPTPHFEMRMIRGPSPKLGLAQDVGVVVVEIPRGHDTPYVHSSGRIYRRVADQSDPSPETDRAVLDNLWQRRREAEEALKRVLGTAPELSDGEKNLPLLSLFLLPDPLGDRGCWSSIKLADFRHIMNSTPESMGDFKCETVFSVPSGYVGRQVGRASPFNVSLLLEHHRSGATVARLPIRSVSIGADDSDKRLEGYKHAESFLSFCRSQGAEGCRYLDLNLLLSVMIGVVSKHERLLEAGGIPATTHLKGNFMNVWRCVPFVDTASYIEQIRNDGIPVLQRRGFSFPDGEGSRSLQEMIEVGGEGLPPAVKMATVPWAMALQCVGLEEQIGERKMVELWEAALRGACVHAAK